jgi:hypothetical protein
MSKRRASRKAVFSTINLKNVPDFAVNLEHWPVSDFSAPRFFSRSFGARLGGKIKRAGCPERQPARDDG